MTVANSGIQGPEARGSPGAHEHALKASFLSSLCSNFTSTHYIPSTLFISDLPDGNIFVHRGKLCQAYQAQHDPTFRSVARSKLTLQTWAHALPSSMRFDENTLSTAVARLDSTRHTVSRSGWLFAYMHAMAECGMFYLQAALATIGADYTAQRQSQAVDNIAVILEAIGARGRESPLSECLSRTFSTRGLSSLDVLLHLSSLWGLYRD